MENISAKEKATVVSSLCLIFFSLIPCHWSLGMDGYCGRQAKERSPKLLGKTRESGSRKGQAVVPTGFLPFWVSGLRLQLSTLVSLAW